VFLLVTHVHNEKDDRRIDTGQRNCAYGVVNICIPNVYRISIFYRIKYPIITASNNIAVYY